MPPSVQIFDSGGEYIWKWGKEGAKQGQFLQPRALAVDGSGNVYVADAKARIQVFRVEW